jgi:hypothetical protein
MDLQSFHCRPVHEQLAIGSGAQAHAGSLVWIGSSCPVVAARDPVPRKRHSLRNLSPQGRPRGDNLESKPLSTKFDINELCLNV